jgi:hypothetical protein
MGREFDWELARDMGMRMILPGDEGWKPEKVEPPAEEKQDAR